MLSSPPQVSTVIDIDPRELVWKYRLSEKGLSVAIKIPYSSVRKWFSGHGTPQPHHHRSAGFIRQAIDQGIYQVERGYLFRNGTQIG